MPRCTASGTNLESNRSARRARGSPMASTMEILVSLLPLLTIAVLMVGFYWPATRAMPVAWLVAIAAGVVGWGMNGTWIAAATINGFITAANILYIVFG